MHSMYIPHVFLGAITNPRLTAGPAEIWAAAELLHQTFGGSQIRHAVSLQAPFLDANVFFAPYLNPAPLIAVMPGNEEQEGLLDGAAQVVLARLRAAAGAEQAGRSVAFLQSVVVAPSRRRCGVATKLVSWCEASAVAQWAETHGVDEAWLAVADGNDGARSLYLSSGYVPCSHTMQNTLMRKHLGASALGATKTGTARGGFRTHGGGKTRGGGVRMVEVSETEVATAISAEAAEVVQELGAEIDEVQDVATGANDVGLGRALASLMRNVATQGMYVGIGALGISFLLEPFGGPSVARLLGLPSTSPWLPSTVSIIGTAAPTSVTVGFECLLGLSLALLELNRLGVLPNAELAKSDDRLQYTPAQALQMAPIYRIAAGFERAPSALLSLAVWQLSIACAEEIYYRGLIQSAMRMLSLAALPVIPPVLAEVPPIILASALFGFVHTEFSATDTTADTTASRVEDVEQKRWFVVTAAYGAAYGLLHAVTGHRLLAPICMHAGLNTGLCLRDWQRMRKTSSSDLRAIFNE
mmetsp:Transcript_73819/g.123321  ORF Transcript_73819/g.123321 Transcript_73819/m.123321 type:complete len:527 (-) Transcript_73819:305-1885(-)